MRHDSISHPQVSPELQIYWKMVRSSQIWLAISDAASSQQSSPSKPPCSDLHLFLPPLCIRGCPPSFHGWRWPVITLDSSLFFSSLPTLSQVYALLTLALAVSHVYILSSPSSVCLELVASSYFSMGYYSRLPTGLWDTVFFSWVLLIAYFGY